MLELDYLVLNFLNEFAQKSWILDKFFVFLTNNTLLKGGVITTLIWSAWFNTKDSDSRNRKIVILMLASAFFSMIFVRFLAFILPFRFRPMHDPNFNFVLPQGMNQKVLDGWSSFPSDHAVLYFSLAVGLYFISKRVGTFAIFYSIFFILLPRAYVGLHYPSDLIVGAFIGFLFTISFIKYLSNISYVNWILRFSDKNTAIFYSLFFLLTYQISEIFDGIRAIGNAIMLICDSFI